MVHGPLVHAGEAPELRLTGRPEAPEQNLHPRLLCNGADAFWPCAGLEHRRPRGRGLQRESELSGADDVHGPGREAEALLLWQRKPRSSMHPTAEPRWRECGVSTSHSPELRFLSGYHCLQRRQYHAKREQSASLQEAQLSHDTATTSHSWIVWQFFHYGPHV